MSLVICHIIKQYKCEVCTLKYSSKMTMTWEAISLKGLKLISQEILIPLDAKPVILFLN